MEKLDLKKQLKSVYHASATAVTEVDVPALYFLMIDGHGDPNSSSHYAAAVEALFTVAYTLKFMVKKSSTAIDYAVMPLEGLWWADDMAAFVADRKNEWRWTMMIMQPDFITAGMVADAIATAGRKKPLSALDQLRFESFQEGPCAQILHKGPFSEEGPTIDRLHQYIDAHGQLTGKHHEIYLSDIRKAAPVNWKTIIRQPFTK
ncbi:GyrI-like domain-containing protein [Undibacterium sp. TS12]|uniref:GyrI-like domain-containing protein n=1 Tax=Undibacterium sp. TS12 TaxID=2908202 RepID=UPI001F4D29AF|nr:GyrI-like domain-containing protein [Undibacterium sp. TS12]MCH8621202.1 GyrI-like domain-containing protein [Undibacterium sp. TS12]